jgi:hypothetical protein
MRAALSLAPGMANERVVVWIQMIRYLSIAVLLAVGVTGRPAHAQPGEAVPVSQAGAKVQTLKPVRQEPLEPRLDSDGQLPMQVLVHPANSMNPANKELAAGAAAAVRQRAGFLDLGFEEGDWQESQLECPAFPRHMFLRFTRRREAGDISMFAASIPRGKEGRVRVIPILRRGYSLISPAPVSRATIAAFNQIRAEEHIGDKADWSAVSLCYAALTSERWTEPQGEIALTPVGSRTLQLGDKGELTVAVEVGAPAQGRWAVTYDRKGQLESTEYIPFGDLEERILPATLTDPKGTPLPATTVDTGQPVSTGPANKQQPVPAAPPEGASKPQ